MQPKDIKYIKGISEVLEQIAKEIEKHGVTSSHLTMLKEIGSTLLFIGVGSSWVVDESV